MKVYFTCSPKKLYELREYYKKIRSALIQNGHEVVADWLPSGIDRHSPSGVRTKIDRKEFYKKIEENIKTCDILLVEGTIDSMSLGWQIAKALMYDKEVVFLQITQEDIPPIHPFVEGIMSPRIKYGQYSLENVEKIIRELVN